MSSCIRLVFKSNRDMPKVADFIHEFICGIGGIHILGETHASVDYRPQLSYNIGHDGAIEIVYVPRDDYSIDVTMCDSDESV